jgi:hypothetical protein
MPRLIDRYYGIPEIILNYGPRVDISAGGSTKICISAGHGNGEGTDHWAYQPSR